MALKYLGVKVEHIGISVDKPCQFKSTERIHGGIGGSKTWNW